jgi:hypothetical protein
MRIYLLALYKYRLRNFIIFLTLGATLALSPVVATTSQVYAGTSQKQLDPDTGSSKGATEDQTTDEGDNEEIMEKGITELKGETITIKLLKSLKSDDITESSKALRTLCDIVSKDESANVKASDCRSLPQQDTTEEIQIIVAACAAHPLLCAMVGNAMWDAIKSLGGDGHTMEGCELAYGEDAPFPNEEQLEECIEDAEDAPPPT